MAALRRRRSFRRLLSLVVLGAVVVVVGLVAPPFGSLPSARALAPGVTGRVLDTTGVPIAGATVRVYDTDTVFYTRTTDANGYYTVDTCACSVQVRFTAKWHLPRWHASGATKSAATTFTTSSAAYTALPDMRLTKVTGQVATGRDTNNNKDFALPFVTTNTPIAMNIQQVFAEDVGVYGLTNACKCIVLGDGTVVTNIPSVGAQTSAGIGSDCTDAEWPCSYANVPGDIENLQIIVFRKLTIDSGSKMRMFQNVGTAGNGYNLEINTTGGTLGGISAGGNPMWTVVWGRMWMLSIAGTCWINWSGALGTFTGLNAGGYCVGISAYAIQTFDGDPVPNPISNPLNLPAAQLTVTSK